MTVNDTTSKITHTGNGATTIWTFPFPSPNATSIFVFITNLAGTITQVPANQYTVALNPPIDPNPTSVGGQVQYPVSGLPLAVGNLITIARIVPAIQTASISNQSIVYPPVIEQEFDYLTMLAQGASETSDRAIKTPIGEPTMPDIPPKGLRANQQAVFNANGDLVAGGAVIGTIISAAMVPVVTATTLPDARTAMGVPPIDSPIFTGDPQAPQAPLHDNDTSIATTAWVTAELLSIGDIFTTGDMKPTHKNIADPGWIFWVDGTIGNATSNASVRANADVSALFTLYYTAYSDVSCPLLTSAGVATTRAAQGTAATAFGASCQVTLPRGSGRAIGATGAGAGLTGRTLGGFTGAETIIQTVAQMPVHAHSASSPAHSHSPTWGPYGVAPISAVDIGQANWEPHGSSGLTGVDFTLNSVSVGVTVNANGSGQAMNIMNPTAYVNWMIKL